MPFTLFAHQAPVLPLKLYRPRWFDGTALGIGSMAPDFASPFEEWLSFESHSLLGIATWGVVCTLVVCFAIRSWVAATAFAHLPDAGPLRLHSYRVLALRRPPIWQTVVGALIGAATHVFIDGFTHVDRFGADWAGIDEIRFDLPVRGEVTLTRILQYTGHSLGSLIAFALLVYIGRGRLLERWYGGALVQGVRQFRLDTGQRVVFWAVVAAGIPSGLTWAALTSGMRPVRVIDALAVTTALACLLPIARPRPEKPVPSPDAELQER